MPFYDRLNRELGCVMSSVPINSPYLTAAEAAAYIRSTIQGIYALVKRGRVKPMPGTRKLLFTREALDRFLNGKNRG